MNIRQIAGINYAGPTELLMIILQLICYLNSYYVTVFILGPLPFTLILILTLINVLALTALYQANITHLHATPNSP